LLPKLGLNIRSVIGGINCQWMVQNCAATSGVRRKFSWGGFIQ